MATATASPVMTSHHHHQQSFYQPSKGVSYNPSALPTATTTTTITAPPAGPTSTVTSPTPLSPSQSSPTSPRGSTTLANLNQPTRQLRPHKQPLYVPAALRPTEKPIRNSPPKNGEQQATGSAAAATGAGDGLEGRTRTIIATPATPTAVTRVQSDEWPDEVLGDVTGPPSRNHWKVRGSFCSCCAVDCRRKCRVVESVSREGGKDND